MVAAQCCHLMPFASLRASRRGVARTTVVSVATNLLLVVTRSARWFLFALSSHYAMQENPVHSNRCLIDCAKQSCCRLLQQFATKKVVFTLT